MFYEAGFWGTIRRRLCRLEFKFLPENADKVIEEKSDGVRKEVEISPGWITRFSGGRGDRREDPLRTNNRCNAWQSQDKG